MPMVPGLCWSHIQVGVDTVGLSSDHFTLVGLFFGDENPTQLYRDYDVSLN